MSDATRVHRAALSALREAARATAGATDPGSLPDVLTRCAVDAAGPEGLEADRVAGLARTFLFAARVGGATADPERAAMWLTGWSRARSRTAAEAHAAVVDGIRFAERLHRTLGIDTGDAGEGPAA